MESVENYEKSPSPLTACSVLRDANLHPVATFSGLPLDGPWMPATALALVLGLIVWCDEVRALRGSLESLRAIPQFVEALSSPQAIQLLASWGLSGEIDWFGVWLTGLPSVPLGILFGALSLHVCLVVCGAAQRGFRGTWRVFAYSATGAALSVVPMVGPLLSLIVVSVQLVTGLGHIHRTTALRVTIALALPLIVVGGFFILVAFALVSRKF